MKKTRSFVFAAAILSAAVFSGCEEKNIETPNPELITHVEGNVITVSSDGGIVEIGCEIINPVESGVLTAYPSETWISDIDCREDTLVVCNVEANTMEEQRTGEINLVYISGLNDSTKVSISIIQEGKAPEEPEEIPIVEPSSEEWSAPAEGGTVTIEYTLKNPVPDGKMSVKYDSDWAEYQEIGDSYVRFSIKENTEQEKRSVEISLVYKYGDVDSVKADVRIVQDAAEPSSDYTYEFEAPILQGVYYGAKGNDGEYDYYTNLSDKGGVSPRPGGTYYILDLWSATPPSDNDCLPPAGTYSFGIGSETKDMTFAHDFSSFVRVDKEGKPDQIRFMDGTVSVEYNGSDMIIDAVLTDVNGDTHHVTFKGPAEYLDYSK